MYAHVITNEKFNLRTYDFTIEGILIQQVKYDQTKIKFEEFVFSEYGIFSFSLPFRDFTDERKILLKDLAEERRKDWVEGRFTLQEDQL